MKPKMKPKTCFLAGKKYEFIVLFSFDDCACE